MEIDLPMPVRRVGAHPEVRDDRGKVALERGPLVYCAEWPDNQGRVSDLAIGDEARLTAEFRPDLFNGAAVIKGRASVLEAGAEGRPGIRRMREFLAIPYFAWAHRGPGEMTVWFLAEGAGECPQ